MIRDLFAYRLSITSVCKIYGLSRQAYYKSLKRHFRQHVDKQKVLMMVREQRKLLPREGVRKLYKRIKTDMLSIGLKIGRDRLYDILKEADMLIKPRRKYVVTTRSSHRFRVHDNLIRDFIPKSAHQLWVTDITYLRTKQGFMYLILMTDAYSRKIVGYDVCDSLGLEGCLRTLKMALKSLPGKHELIHHSDRGFQYCSSEYTNLLKANNIKISMASKGNCYENALAERMNGILKQEFYLDQTFKDKNQVVKACKQAIHLYNNLRVHMSIGYLTPNEKHVA